MPKTSEREVRFRKYENALRFKNWLEEKHGIESRIIVDKDGDRVRTLEGACLPGEIVTLKALFIADKGLI